jgi:acetyl esterase/lipase
VDAATTPAGSPALGRQAGEPSAAVRTHLTFSPPPAVQHLVQQLALVSYYGCGDLDGSSYTEPSDHYRTAWPFLTETKELFDLRVGVVTRPRDERQAKTRERHYIYLRQHGPWTREVTGSDPINDRVQPDALCPARNVTSTYPPTRLIHGAIDTDLPYARSVGMSTELARVGVEHELVTIHGAGHGLASVDSSLVAKADATAAAFLVAHLGYRSSVTAGEPQ